MVIPFSLAKFRMFIAMCDEWLSRIKITGRWTEHRVCLKKSEMYVANVTSVIQPDLLADPAESIGAPRRKCVLKFTLGNTKNGGSACPTALTVHAKVTF